MSRHGAPARRLRIAATLGALVLGLVPAVALAAPRSPFSPVTPQASDIEDLFIISIIAAGALFIIVFGVMFYSAFAHRERPGRVAAQFHGNTRVEVVWTVVPALLLLVMYVLTIRTMGQVTYNGGGNPLVIDVTGHQFWWQFYYEDAGITTANELHVPLGQPVLLKITSADVIHSFWVPQIQGKVDANPGHVNDIYFTPDQIGTFDGQCAEFCGLGHGDMRISVIVQSTADYNAWVTHEKQPAQKPTGALAIKGEQIFQSQTCGSCHTIAGTSAHGLSAPDLTHVGSRAMLASETIPNTLPNMETWLQDPQAVKPGTLMPDFKFKPDQVKALATYLEGLK